jgi:hypothetical protein
MASKLVQPLYFLNSSIALDLHNNISEYEVAVAVENVLDNDDDLKGCNKIKNLWRVYVNSVTARTKLILKGIDLHDQHVPLMSENPYNKSNTASNTLKVTISDIKLHYTNEHIESHLKSIGARLVKPVTHSAIKDYQGRDTKYIGGDRLTYVDAEYTKAHPLPKFVLIGDCVARISHFGQTPRKEYCSKCYSPDHPVWRCVNGQACRVCKHLGHREGEEMCQFYHRNDNLRTFGSRKDPFSNFHPCRFKYDKNTYPTREHAFQHQKAKICKQNDVAEEMLKTDNPAEVKALSKCIIINDKWKDREVDIMGQVCYSAACQSDKYRSALLRTGQDMLIETVPGQSDWGSGLTHHATQHTRIDKLPGTNKMGEILMYVRGDIADKLLSEYEDNQREVGWYDGMNEMQAAYNNTTVHTQIKENSPVHVHHDVECSNSFAALSAINEDNGFSPGGRGRGVTNSTIGYVARGRGRAKRNLSNISTSPQPSSKTRKLYSSSFKSDNHTEEQFQDAKTSTPNDDLKMLDSTHAQNGQANMLSGEECIFPDEEFW